MQADISTGLTPAGASFISGFKGPGGGEQRLSWANYTPAPGVGSTFYGAQNNPVQRDRQLAAAISADLLTSNSTVATLVNVLTTHVVGTGLTCSAKLAPVAARLGVSEEDARAFARDLEALWRSWKEEPAECDANNFHTLDAMAASLFAGWLTSGEALAILPWRRYAGVDSMTKVGVLDPRQIASDKTSRTPNEYVFQGVQFDRNARFQGLWLREQRLGDINSTATPKFERERTHWGRPRLFYRFAPLVPGMSRGVSPLVAALTSARDREVLQELMVAAIGLQTSQTITVESNLPPPAAYAAMQVNDPMGGTMPDPLALREAWYAAEQARIKLDPATVNHLAPGDQLHYRRPEAVTLPYGAFESALSREAARAAGAQTEDVTGDWSKTSYSGGRMAGALPYATTLVRRKTVIEPFYKTAFAAWLEEALETGRLKLPPGAVDTAEALPIILGATTFKGAARMSFDPEKDAKAHALNLSLGLTTRSAILDESGLDFSETVAQLKEEREALIEAGLLDSTVFATTTTEQKVEKSDDTEPGPQRPARPDQPDHEEESEDETE